MVLAFRDWVTWQAFFNRDSRKSSSARAEGRQGESEKGECQSPAPRPSVQPARSRIQMMTGTAAATFPISSSVCMIFLIRACQRKGTELGRRSLRPCRRAGGSQGVPREKGREAPSQGRAWKGAGRQAANT